MNPPTPKDLKRRVNKDLPINNADYAEMGHQGFKPGNPGKPKGCKTEFTTLKDAFINAFKRIGGEDRLVELLTPEDMKILDKKGKLKRILDLKSGRQLDYIKIIAGMLPRDVAVSLPPADKTKAAEILAQLHEDEIKSLIATAKTGSEGTSPSR